MLKSILGDNYYIFPQVNLDKIVHVQKGTGKYLSHFHRINQYSVDFLVCDKNSISPLFVIELDDSTHLAAKRIERDDFVNAVLVESGVGVLRVQAKLGYSVQEISSKIHQFIS